MTISSGPQGRGRGATGSPPGRTLARSPARKLTRWHVRLYGVVKSGFGTWWRKARRIFVNCNLPGTSRGHNHLQSPAPTPSATRWPTKSSLSKLLNRLKRGFLSIFKKWSKRAQSLAAQMFLVTLVLLANICLTIYANVQYPSSGAVGLVYQGTCDEVNALNLWLHVLITILSMLMLSASNYCMQLQVSPTRTDLVEAHKAGEWVDIGLHTLRNVRHVRGWRRISWAILALTSVPINMLYNSAVFQSLTSFDYTIAVVKDSFMDGFSFSIENAQQREGTDWSFTDDSRINPPNNYTEVIESMRVSALSSSPAWPRYNASACFDYYSDYFAPQANGLIFVKNASIQDQKNDSLLLYVSVIPRTDDWGKNMWALKNGSTSAKGQIAVPAGPVTPWFLGKPYYEVDHCLLQQPPWSEKKCQLEYSPWILWVVCFFNLTKMTVIFTIWLSTRRTNKKRKNESTSSPRADIPLDTLGDAIMSFMRVPDPNTEKMSLAGSQDFRKPWRLPWRRGGSGQHHPNKVPRLWKSQQMRWMHAADVQRWFSFILLAIFLAGLLPALLLMSFKPLKRRGIPTSMASFWSMGFGDLEDYTFLYIGLPTADPFGLVLNILVANAPQLLVSLFYISYNTMLTTFLVQREFSRMYRQHKTLRVSDPVGEQRSSYPISLPFKYGVFLQGSSAAMNWLISQALFLARITALNPDGSVNRAHSFSTCGYSPVPVVIACLMLGLLVLSIFCLGFLRYEGPMPLVSTNSLAISAACHVLPRDVQEGYLKPLRWGVVSIDANGVGHCSFTTAPDGQVGKLEQGRLYS